MTLSVLEKSQEWLQQRKKGIGSSDAGLVCLKVLNKGKAYEKTILDLYNEKVGNDEIEEFSSIAADMGTILEGYVIYLFLEENPEWELAGKQVHRAHPDHKFMQANLDAVIMHTKTKEYAILECKTTDFTNHGKWIDEVPTPYYLQVQHQLACSQYDRGFIAVLFGNKKYDQFEIKRDDTLISEMITTHYIPFWNCVENKTPPELEGDVLTLNAVKKAYPEAKEPGILLNREYETHIKEYIRLNGRIKELDEEKEAHQAILIGALKNAEAGMLDNFIVSYKNRNSIDTERLLAEKPEVFQKYQKPSLDTTEFRKHEKDLAKDYSIVTGRTFSIKEK